MIFLDANILLEMLLPGRKNKEAVYKWLSNNKKRYVISMLTVHLVLHFGLEEKMTLTELQSFLYNYPKTSLTPEDYIKALAILKDDDHEDALQLATAERVDCTEIVTLDKKFISNYQHRINFVNPVT